MQDIDSSIIIPVYNNWDYTRICLKSLANTVDHEKTEVIVVDNASSDVTPRVCPGLGVQLLGDNFKYVRNEQNKNFAGASNQGARMARGRFVIFMNNDTEARPGWHRPLFEDFASFANLAATGPLLAYPPEEPFGLTVQHLGVLVTHNLKVGHLYAGIPVSSPLAKKRRFFQAITAACMMMPRQLFLDAGLFEESLINGFEDVDLGARLSANGLRMTVNPDSLVIHYESRTPGRHDHEVHNSNIIANSLKYLKPDWQPLLAEDGLEIALSPWQILDIRIPAALAAKIERRIKASPQDLQDAVIQYPYWENGWELLGKQKPEYKNILGDYLYKLYKSPERALRRYMDARAENNRKKREEARLDLLDYLLPPEQYLQNAHLQREWCAKLGLKNLSDQYERWIANYGNFKNRVYLPIAKAAAIIEKQGKGK